MLIRFCFSRPHSGRTHVHPALDLSIPDVRSTFEVNVFGMMAVVAAFSDLLITAKGLIINIASLAAARESCWVLSRG